MPHDIEQLCRLAYARYSEGDFDGLLALFEPEVEVYVAPPNFESGTYQGHAAYRQLIERWGASWDEMRIAPRSMDVAGDWIVAFVEYIGRVKGSELQVTQPSWEVSFWPEGRCRRYEVYWEREAGLRAFRDRTERGRSRVH